MMRFCEERVLHFFCFLSAFSFLKKKIHPLVLLRLSSAYVLL